MVTKRLNLAVHILASKWFCGFGDVVLTDEPLRVSSDVYWVGVNDSETKFFEGIWDMPEGISYNSYLVKGSEKTALIDSVLGKFEEEHFDKIGRLIDLSKIDYLIINHMEPDHTGALPKLLEKASQAQVILTPMAMNMLKNFYHVEPRILLVRGDDVTIDLGGRTLRFIQTPWLYWPETMCTYLMEKKILFSCDAFGSFKRLPEGSILESDVENVDRYMNEASKKYFAGVFSGQREWVLKAIEKFEHMNIDAQVLAPSHGPVYSANAKEIINRWASWSRPIYTRNVVVAVGSMYGMTAKFVKTIVEGVEEAGGRALVYDLTDSAPAEVLAAVLDAPALMIGTPTYERDLFPRVRYFLNFLETKKLSDRFVGVFGSFGWSGEGTRKVTEQLNALGFKLVGKPLAVIGSPVQEDLQKAKALAKMVTETALSERRL
jgi:flavorubredoxin